MLSRVPLLLPALLVALPSVLLTSLSPQTTSDYEAYLGKVQPPLLESVRSKQVMPWLNGFSGDLDKIRNGEVPVHSLTGKNGQEIRDGLIHDWVGGIFIPGATMKDVMGVIQNADRQKDWYSEVIESKLLERRGDVIRSQWLLLRKSLVEVVFDTELESRYTEITPNEWLVVSSTTSVREIEDYGTKKQKQYASGQGFGLMWRFNSFWNFQQRPDGVYGTLRVVSLSRQVPTGLGWIVNPFIRSVPSQSVTNTLVNTRNAVKKG
jgi:hypothetical protein